MSTSSAATQKGTALGMKRALILATTSRHKQEELQAIFAHVGIALELPTSLPEVVEDKDTFAKNAELKAKTSRCS